MHLSIQDIKQALQQPLPGLLAQQKMAPAVRTKLVEESEGKTPRDGGVLLLLYPNPDQVLHFVLTKRPDYDGVHSGQVSLPGGKREPGEVLEQTALRETEEEIGVSPADLTLLGPLSSLYIPPSNFMVHPYVAYAPTPLEFQPDPHEVAEIIETPVDYLLDPANQLEELWNHARLGPTQIPFYNIFGHRVWGATAMILAEFAHLLHE